MSLRPMVFLGGISYPLYPWHYPLINLYSDRRGKAPGLLTGSAIAAVAVALDWLTKVIVEDRIRLLPACRAQMALDLPVPRPWRST